MIDAKTRRIGLFATGFAALLLSSGCQTPGARRLAARAEQEHVEDQLDAIQSEIRVLTEKVNSARQASLEPTMRSDKPLVLRMEVEPVMKNANDSKSAPVVSTRAGRYLRVDVPPLTVQKALQNAGYSPGPLDGRIGPRTVAAIQKFQKKNGLKADGVVGQETWTILQAFAE